MGDPLYHSFSLPLHSNPQCLDPCINEKWIALPISKTVVGLWKRRVPDAGSAPLPVELRGHLQPIDAIAFSRYDACQLASACRDKILLWDLKSEDERQISNQVIISKPGDVVVMCFSNSGSVIAAAVDCKILLSQVGKRDPLASLEVHSAMVTGLEFCPHYSATLVSISDDRSYCVWDVSEMTLLYQSVIISPAPLISLCMHLSNPHMVVGSADGKMKVFDLTDGNGFRQLTSLDVCHYLKKHHEKQEAVQNDTSPGLIQVNKKGKVEAQIDDVPNVVETSESVLAIEYAYFSQDIQQSNSLPLLNVNSGVYDVLGQKPASICIITSSAMVQINSRTFEILNVTSFLLPIPSNTFGSSVTVGAVSYAALKQTGSLEMLAVVGTLFEKKIHILRWFIQEENNQNINPIIESVDNLSLNIIAEDILLASSPLKSEMFLPSVSPVVTKGDIATGKKKQTTLMNQPLTFKSKVKSSGYSAAPRTTMFKPETCKKKLLNLTDNSKPNVHKSDFSCTKILKEEYDVSKGPPTDLSDSFNVDEQSGTAVLSLRFSDDGSGLACALSNKCGLLIKSPFNKHKCTTFVGHNNTVNSVYWSSDNKFLLTASNDKSAAIWDRTGGDPLMQFTHQYKSVKEQQIKGTVSSDMVQKKSAISMKAHGTRSQNNPDKLPSSVRENRPFNKEIKHAQFYFMDKFILLTSGRDLLLYNYNVNHERHEIKRYQSQSRYKLVSSWQTQSSCFTACTAVNTFFSHLVLCTTSGRSLEVYDLNRSILTQVFSDCHTRPAHCLVINEGSCFASQPPEAHNVIASIAPTDPIKIWDLRTRTNVQALQGHMNGAHACKISFSPCGNYLASGSEDRLVYLFDLRMGTFCERLRGHNEVVSSIAFNPANPLLATGSLNSKILFFKSI